MTDASLLPANRCTSESTSLLPSSSHVGRKSSRNSKLKQIVAASLLSLAVFRIFTAKIPISNDLTASFEKREQSATNFKLKESSYRALFEIFKESYDRQYEDDLEEQSRYQVFKSNVDIVKELEEQNPLARFSVSQFSDQTTDEISMGRMSEEFSSYDNIFSLLPTEIIHTALRVSATRDNSLLKSKLTGNKISKSQFGWITEDDCAACRRYPELEKYDLSNMPDEWDWRKEYETPVVNQGLCGSCWSFSTAGDIEGSWFLATGQVVELSKQQLISCDQMKGATEGCNGGFPFAAMQYVSKTGGLAYESDYPYTNICVWNCPESAHSPPTCDKDIVNNSLRSGRVAHIGGWQMVALGEYFEDLLALAVLKNGPVSIALNAYIMEFYRSGIVQSGARCDPDLLDHAVLLVGFGVENGVKYWIIKNSWGEQWGEKGYMRVVRGVNFCGLANFAVTSVVENP